MLNFLRYFYERAVTPLPLCSRRGTQKHTVDVLDIDGALSPCRPCYIYPVWLTRARERERDPPFLPLMRYCSLYILITLALHAKQQHFISARRVFIPLAGDKITRARNSRCVLRAFTFARRTHTSRHLSRWNNLIIF